MDDEIDEEYEPILPRASEPPPLKRLWVAPEEESPAAASPSLPKKKSVEVKAEPPVEKPRKKKKKVEEEVIDDGTGAIKLEATPALDTYEARQTARWLFGGILATILFVSIVIVVNAFKGNGTEEARNDAEPPENRANADARAQAEREARSMLDMARQSDRNGKTKAAVDQLKKVTTVYKGTAAAREAQHAIDRYQQDKTLFGEEVAIQPSGPKPPPPGSGTAPGPVAPKNESLAVNTNNSTRGVKSPGNIATAPTAPTTPTAPVNNIPPPQPIVTKPLPAGYRPNFQHPIHASGWPSRITCDKDGADLILVPAATFVMGRDDGEEQEGPAHEVFVSTYYIDLHEVTVGQYLRFLKDSGRALDLAKLGGNGKPVSEDLPIVNISSNDAKAYCTWAKRRLPTEAQWELAARGPEGRVSFWNEQLPRKDPEKGDRPMEPIMTLSTDLSPYGIYDMGANAWEWTSEFYETRYYKRFRNRAVDPTGPKEPPAKPALETVKGGSNKGILTWRKGLRLELRFPYVGFRGALPVEGAPVAPVTSPAENTAPALKGGVQPF